MHLDVVEIRDFYTGRLGQMVRQHIARHLLEHWPRGSGLSLAGVGYASPYLKPYLADSCLVTSMSPAGLGGLIWPKEGPLRSLLVDEQMLPIGEASFDRILVVHGLEFFADVESHLREMWRVMRPDGRLILIVPNRSGLWARVDQTPFGNGRPFSRGQLHRLLVDTEFRPLTIEPLVHFAPFEFSLGLMASPAFEKLGSKVWPRFSGMLMVEAIKEVVQPIRPRGLRASVPNRQPGRVPVRARQISDRSKES